LKIFYYESISAQTVYDQSQKFKFLLVLSYFLWFLWVNQRWVYRFFLSLHCIVIHLSGVRTSSFLAVSVLVSAFLHFLFC
jgi:hypothetical protein